MEKMASKKEKICLPRGEKGLSKEEKSTPGSPMSESDNKMNNISRNYSSHNFTEMHPNCPMHYSIKNFSEEHAFESPSNEIEQRYTHRTPTQAGCITIPPHYLKIIPFV